MSRQAKIIIFSVILVFSIYQRQINNDEFLYETEVTESNEIPKYENNETKVSDEIKETPKIETPKYENNKPKVSDEIIVSPGESLFTAKPSKKTIGINQRLRLDFTMKKDGDNFEPPIFKGFSVVGGPNQSISNSYINGKRNYTKTYSYFLKPKSQGRFTIKQATIQINKKTYRTNPVDIVVTGPVILSEDDTIKTSPSLESSNTTVYQPKPKNGYSPYDEYFSKGIYNNSSGNSFKIENSNETDAVVLLVNAYSGKKIRNEFVRKGTTFEMSGVPNGTYYLEWFSGTDWWGGLKVGTNFKGGFQTKASFTKTKDASDWMRVEGYQIWTVTLYSVVGGDVESEKINAEDFFN